MAPAWTAEVVVSAGQARQLIGEQFAELAPVSVEGLDVGFDNTAFRVNGTYVFRFPRREVAAPLIESEARVMPVVTPCLPLPVPVIHFLGRPTAAYRWAFAGHAMVPRRTACSASPDERQRERVAEPLGRFLAALHGFPAATAAAHGASGDSLGRLDVVRRASKARAILERLRQARIVEDPEAVARVLEAAISDCRPRRDVLVHGDLYARHLLVDDENRLCGVIDWGDAHLREPAVDLAGALLFLPPGGQVTFWRVYGRVSEAVWKMARFRAVWHSLAVLDYAAATGQAELMRETRRGLEHLAAAAISW